MRSRTGQMVLLVGLCCLQPQLAWARMGASAPTVGTWDTRASSISLQYLEGVINNGALRFASYFTNFSSTTGRLSSQFGLHYIGYGEGAATAHGMAGTITAMYEIPSMARRPSGLAPVAVAPYVGISPSGIISSNFVSFSIPAHFGIGVPISPADWFTITPWAEATVGLDADLDVNRDAINNVANGTTKSTDAKFSDLIGSNTSLHLASRFGVSATFHLDKRIDLQFSGLMNWLARPIDNSGFVFMGGGSLVWHWDNIVPGVLPDNGCPPQIPRGISETSMDVGY